MAEFRVTYWRDLPSLVTAREGEHTAKAKVRSDAPSGHFDCTASIGGKVAKAYGIDIIP